MWSSRNKYENKYEKESMKTTVLLRFTTSDYFFAQKHNDPLFRTVSWGSQAPPGFPGSPGVSSQKVQRVSEVSRRFL